MPNGNLQPEPQFAAALRRFERLIAYAAVLCVGEASLVLAGDHGVMPGCGRRLSN